MLMNQQEMDIYQTKYNHLLEYCSHMSQMNNRLKHRLYHVRKEINHLKQLKRVLCERLLLHRAVIIDSNLEIPDNDSSVSLKDKSIVDVTLDILNNFGCFNFLAVNEQTRNETVNGSGGNSRKRKLPVKKENGDEQPTTSSNRKGGGSSVQRDNKRRKARDDAKRSIISIIESIVSDTPKSEGSVKSEPSGIFL
ncbi:hypothetical protein Mgra_00005092 [Meloidogyne graminicola]|uniref:INO80 complex subunit F domain-containing protein n=1 Tax=Meloidogyne graminicola TaxID=189291 RepID=A0A8S9ZQ28_9BILA|nr:hypothetical protein Mgra_00005092 [Meloidogyne graminicola]